MSLTSSQRVKASRLAFQRRRRIVGFSVYQQAIRIAPDGRLVILARALRTFGYGFTSVLLGVVLADAGVSPVQIGLLLMVAALGSIAFTLIMGMYSDRVGRKHLLIVSALLMMGTGFLFALTQMYPLLLIAAFCGTISPSTNDNTPFSAVEQAVLAQRTPPGRHTTLFAFYNLAAQLAGAIGGLLVGLPDMLVQFGIDERIGVRCLFALYGLLAASMALLFTRLSPDAELRRRKKNHSSRLANEDTISTEIASSHQPQLSHQKQKLRGVVLQLSSLFALDAFAGGLAVQTILAIWFRQRFGVSLSSLGFLFFGVNLLAALSFLAAPWLTRRLGFLKTMIGPHLVSNIFLLLVPCMHVSHSQPSFSCCANLFPRSMSRHVKPTP